MPPIKGKMLAYPEEDIKNALEDVRLGMLVATAAKKPSVQCLLYKSKGKSPTERKMGPKTILSREEEDVIDCKF